MSEQEGELSVNNPLILSVKIVRTIIGRQKRFEGKAILR